MVSDHRPACSVLDAIHLVKVVGEARRWGADAVIMDRYIYDELANLPLTNFMTRILLRMVNAWLVPQPDVAYLLDADPVEACQRKPEYPITFLYAGVPIMAGANARSHDSDPSLELADALREVESAFAVYWRRSQQAIESDLDAAQAA